MLPENIGKKVQPVSARIIFWIQIWILIKKELK